MKIGIIGGGAIGLLFAAFLSELHVVTVYTRTEKQALDINGMGVKLQKNGQILSKFVKASPISNGLGGDDLFIVAVKQYHLKQILPFIKETEASLLFLQNGYAHVCLLEQLASKEISLGVVEHGALKHNSVTVEHTGMGLTRIAAYSGNLLNLTFLSEDITDFPFATELDYQAMLYNKLLVNAVINPLTAMLKVKNGQLLANPHYYQLFTTYFQEVASIMELEDKKVALEHIKEVCRNTAENRSSMLKDMEEGRQTEIDAITGYLLTTAKEKNIPHERTAFVYSIIKGMTNEGEVLLWKV